MFNCFLFILLKISRGLETRHNIECVVHRCCVNVYYLLLWHCCKGCRWVCPRCRTGTRNQPRCTCECHRGLRRWTAARSHQRSSHLCGSTLVSRFNTFLLLFEQSESKSAFRTDGVQLDALVAQTLRVDVDVVLGFAVSDQHTDLQRFGSHPHVLFKVVLKDVVQSQACDDRNVDYSSFSLS